MPEWIWVTGPDTGIGKTTVATALIRELNERGRQAVGFKPFGITRLRHEIDFVRHELTHGRLYGNDAAELRHASPLTPVALAEVVNPCQFLVFHFALEVLLVRSGSPVMGDLHYAAVGERSPLWQRPGVGEIVRDEGWLSLVTERFPQRRIREAPVLYEAEINRAAGHLSSLGARTVVCEGAGPLFPAWQGAPEPAHMVVVQPHQVTLLSDFTPAMMKSVLEEDGRRLRNPAQFAATYSGRSRILPFPIAGDEEIRSVASDVVRALATDIC